MTYLLDTCVFSDFFKKNLNVIKHFERVTPNKIHVSCVTIMEIEYGLKLNPERAIKIKPVWNSLLKLINIAPYTSECAVATAMIRANLKNKGMLIGPYDILIAGTAIANNFVTVTSNTNEYARILSLNIENWRD